jgi:hypothetical protein
MVPVLREMPSRLDYSFFHWAGVGALPHPAHLLSLADLDMIQWTPGAGMEDGLHPRWWPIYHKTLDAGKSMFIGGDPRPERLSALRDEFGHDINRFAMSFGATTTDQAQRMMEAVSL